MSKGALEMHVAAHLHIFQILRSSATRQKLQTEREKFLFGRSAANRIGARDSRSAIFHFKEKKVPGLVGNRFAHPSKIELISISG